MSRPVVERPGRWSARAAASSAAPRSTCRSPSRRRARASRRARTSSETPSTAWTLPELRRRTRRAAPGSASRRRAAERSGVIAAADARARIRCHVRRFSATGRWQATACPGSESSSAGSTARQTGSAYGQRGWKRHPAGRWTRLGGVPAIGWRRSRRATSSRGTDCRRPHVYGCSGASRIVRERPLLDDLGRRTSPRPRRPSRRSRRGRA